MRANKELEETAIIAANSDNFYHCPVFFRYLSIVLHFLLLYVATLLASDFTRLRFARDLWRFTNVL